MNIQGYVDLVTNHRIVGWGANIDYPDRALELLIILDDVCLTSVIANEMREGLTGLFPGATGHHQFSHEFFPSLTDNKDHVVEVIVKDCGILLPNGHWVLHASDVKPTEPMPLIVTSSGRSGTTLLMREFSRQDAIVVADAYPYEVKLASYYADALKALTHSRSQPDSDTIEFAHIAFEQSRVVANPWNLPELHRAVGGLDLERFFAKTVPRSFSNLFRDIVMKHYAIIGRSQDKDRVRYFAEKLALNEESRPAVRELFGDVKEIVLVRDPRDFLCSARAFWKTSIPEGMQTLRSETAVLERIHAEAPADVLFVRYEDLILDPTGSRRLIYAFLGIDFAGVKEVPQDDEILRRHATTTLPAISIGRWKDELTLDETAACHRQFGTFMRLFQYGE